MDANTRLEEPNKLKILILRIKCSVTANVISVDPELLWIHIGLSIATFTAS